MFCSKCGSQIPDGQMFCGSCGAPVEVQGAAPQNNPNPGFNQGQFNPNGMNQMPKQVDKAKLKKILTIVGASVGGALLLLILILVLVTNANKFNPKDKAFGSDVTEYDGPQLMLVESTIINSDGKVCKDLSKKKDKVRSGFQSDRFGSSAIVLDNEVLYIVKSDCSAEKVATGVKRAGIAADGNFVYYVHKDKKNKDTLYVYDINKGKEITIDSGIDYYSVCISPNGKTLAYVKSDKNTYKNNLYVADAKGRKKKVLKDVRIDLYGVGNNASTIYYVDNKKDDTFYCLQGKKKVELGTGSPSYIFVNETSTEMLFYLEDGSTYYFAPGMKEATEICDGKIYDVYGNVRTTRFSSLYSYGTLVMTDSLKHCVFETQDDEYLVISGDATTTHDLGDVSFVFGAADGDTYTVLALREQEIVEFKFKGSDMDEDVVYDDEYVVGLACSNDLSKIYFVDSDYNLYDFSGYNDSEIEYHDDDDYDYISAFAYSDSDQKLYCVCYRALVAIDASGNYDEVVEDAYYVYDYNGVIYVSCSDCDYIIVNGKTIEIDD